MVKSEVLFCFFSDRGTNLSTCPQGLQQSKLKIKNYRVLIRAIRIQLLLYIWISLKLLRWDENKEVMGSRRLSWGKKITGVWFGYKILGHSAYMDGEFMIPVSLQLSVFLICLLSSSDFRRVLSLSKGAGTVSSSSSLPCTNSITYVFLMVFHGLDFCWQLSSINDSLGVNL